MAATTWEMGSARATLLQFGRLLCIHNPYKYDNSITDPIVMSNEFEEGSVEQQGQIFQDFVYDLHTGKDTSKYYRVSDYVRNKSR